MGSFRVAVEVGNQAGGPLEREEQCESSSEPLLGVVTLEELGLAADPVHRRLIPVPGLLKLA